MNSHPYLERCPCCGDAPFDPFMYGSVFLDGWQRVWEGIKAFLGRRPPRYMTLICWKCKHIVAHVGIDGGMNMEKKHGS